MRVDATQLTVSRGGEAIESVVHRSEDAEYPQYRPGAFQLGGCVLNVQGELPHYLGPLLRTGFSTVTPPSPPSSPPSSPAPSIHACTTWVDEPTLFITRYEYANLYHTTTDWYNAWATLGWAGLLEALPPVHGVQTTRPRTRMAVVWLDGHARGSLDSVWETLYGAPPPTPIAHVAPGTCYARALFVPAGYTAPIYDWPDSCGVQGAVQAFGAFVAGQHGLADTGPDAARAAFVFREPYVAHPRNPGGGASRMLSNGDAVRAVLARHGHSAALNPVTASFRDQLATVRLATVLLGLHGAGLTHVLFMAPHLRGGGGGGGGRERDNAGKPLVLVEIQPPSHHLDHFRKLARWSGVEYTNAGNMGLAATGNEKYSLDTASLDAFLSQHLQAE